MSNNKANCPVCNGSGSSVAKIFIGHFRVYDHGDKKKGTLRQRARVEIASNLIPLLLKQFNSGDEVMIFMSKVERKKETESISELPDDELDALVDEIEQANS